MMNSTNQVASIEAKPTQVTVTRSRAYKIWIAIAKLALAPRSAATLRGNGYRDRGRRHHHGAARQDAAQIRPHHLHIQPLHTLQHKIGRPASGWMVTAPILVCSLRR